MPKCSPSTDRVSDALAAITRATEALFKHTTKAVTIQNSTTRTTVMGSGTGSDALPAKDEVSALVQSMPGVADDDYDDVADAKEARNKIVKSIGGFVKSAVKRERGENCRCADRLSAGAAGEATQQQPQERRGYQERADRASSRHRRYGRRHDWCHA